MFADNLPGYSGIELNVFDLVDSSTRKGPNSIYFGKFFSWNVLDRVFCIELEEYRHFELGSICFRSKRTELRKSRNLLERSFFDFRKKTFWIITLEQLDRSS